jgi:hypothetical protein
MLDTRELVAGLWHAVALSSASIRPLLASLRPLADKAVPLVQQALGSMDQPLQLLLTATILLVLTYLLYRFTRAAVGVAFSLAITLIQLGISGLLLALVLMHSDALRAGLQESLHKLGLQG